MKIRHLFLKAYGPFTDAALDFTGPANLHLVYGANEAGKSSALRAMTDLRYGIPPRSKDDFVHGFKDLLLAGCFEDAAGRAVGLARRKGNRDTLMNADPATGLPVVNAALNAVVDPDVLLALTGGVAREQFDTLYGLNSRHLRQGGQMLVQGEGELGAALFEASTGAAGIKQMLQTLQADAKKYFVPKGQLPVLNEAARQLEEARQRYRQAVTKPDQWKSLKRGHDEAQARLAQTRQLLAGQRRRLGELTELRAVAPLLTELDLAERQWVAAQDHRALPLDAREIRLAACHRQASAQAAQAEADAAIAECRHARLALAIEPLLLTHANAIDRLASDVSLVRREREARLKLQVATDSQARQLMLQAQQMQPARTSASGLEDFFRQAPSSADQAEVLRSLETLQALGMELQHVQARLSADRHKLAQLQREQAPEPAPHLRQALAQALEQAQALGDAPQRLLGLQAGLGVEQRKLDSLSSGMGLQSTEQLTNARWLAAAEIDAWERDRSDLAQRVVRSQNAMEALQTDLALQQRRSKRLAATGEVVTADTLRHARTLREARWQALRAAFINPATTAEKPLPDEKALGDLPAHFEQAQAQADRQADLLREGAQRAAEVAECSQRIVDAHQALDALQTRQSDDATALRALDARWQKTLAGLAIPCATAAGVREWLVARQNALDCQERVQQARLAHALLAQQTGAACQALSAALRALGQALPAMALPLDALLALGTAADRALATAQDALQRWHRDLDSLTQGIQLDQARHAASTLEMQACQLVLDRSSSRLHLNQGARAQTIQARLAELQQWTQGYQTHNGQWQQLRQMQVSEQAAFASAMALGRLLNEAVGEHLDAWMDEVSRRLLQSREAAVIQAALESRQSEEVKRRQRALADLQAVRQVLEKLLRQAGVGQADDLPDAELRSAHRHTLQVRLQGLQDQLAKTSSKDLALLRQELASLDSVAIDLEKQTCAAEIERLDSGEKTAAEAEQAARLALAQIDTSGEAAQAREEMESAIARYRAGVRPWAQLKLAQALLGEALRRHRDKAQGPVVALAGDYFRRMTAGRFVRLVVDADSETPLLLAQLDGGKALEISALSEGTADQLYLALRLAALQIQRKPGQMMPLVLDDVFMTADDERATQMFRALAKFAAASQVLVFTHHHHLLALASGAVGAGELQVHRLESGRTGNRKG